MILVHKKGTDVLQDCCHAVPETSPSYLQTNNKNAHATTADVSARIKFTLFVTAIPEAQTTKINTGHLLFFYHWNIFNNYMYHHFVIIIIKLFNIILCENISDALRITGILKHRNLLYQIQFFPYAIAYIFLSHSWH